MAAKLRSTPNVPSIPIVVPAGGSTGGGISTVLPKIPIISRPPRFPFQSSFAPAWFYSAIGFLGSTFTDANNVSQTFNPYLIGSDVDPYRSIGSTRLFVIYLSRNRFALTVANDVNSLASATPTGTFYENSDAGILELYQALAASSIFPAVKFCYVPARLSSSLSPATERLSSLPIGYDPASGLRSCVIGSALAQIVPLDTFTTQHNQEIFNPSPTIIPVVTALVYDITANNSLNAKTFALPTYYSPELVESSYYVNRHGFSEVLDGSLVHCGQTVLIPGGPGFSDAGSTTLVLQSSSTVSSSNATTSTTYVYSSGTIVTTSAAAISKIQQGVCSLTYVNGSPWSIFSNQTIQGFYKDETWSQSVGVPMYDFGTQNGNFAPASQAKLIRPTNVYDPSSPSLNGATLPLAVQKVYAASYMFIPDKLVTILNQAATSPNDTRTAAASLAVQSSALNFKPSAPPPGPILDDLAVPVSVTVITRPILRIRQQSERQITMSHSIIEEPGPTTFQTGLTASIPREALVGTNITSIEIGTKFHSQLLGQGLFLENLGPAGAVINLNQAHSDIAPFPPFTLELADSGVKFVIGVTYTLSLSSSNLSIRGSDGTSMSTTLTKGAAEGHTFVGSMVYNTELTLISLFPNLQLTLTAPAVGTNGVLQGQQYSVGFVVEGETSLYDIIDNTQTVVASGIVVTTPAATDGSRPQVGGLYFGSFVGGSSQLTVWSTPVFLTVGTSQLSGASFNGSMSIDTVVSGLPSYQLAITDSSLFVFTNINVDTFSIGSFSTNNVFLAGAVINSAPDDVSSQAFAPSKLNLGLIRQAQVGILKTVVFVPEDDSIVIGSIRYMLSIITLLDLPDINSLKPALPYLPVHWPSTQYWQFANKHNPYVDVTYTGETQAERIERAQNDVYRIGRQTGAAQEPVQMFLDTTTDMTTYPIFAFPFSQSTNIIDIERLSSITSSILGMLNTTFPAKPPFIPGPLDGERITPPNSFNLDNPYLSGGVTTANTPPSTPPPATPVITATVGTVVGQRVTDLSQGQLQISTAKSLTAQLDLQSAQTQKNLATLGVSKLFSPVPNVIQENNAVSEIFRSPFSYYRPQPIYGFTVYNSGTGEAYIVEVVLSKDTIPDVLPHPTKNADYDPYYVRVVFLNTLTAYNMSIIVPSMVYDRSNALATLGVQYQNVMSHTDDFEIGYMQTLYDSLNNFDQLSFKSYPPPSIFRPLTSMLSGNFIIDPINFIPDLDLFASETKLYTNQPYSAGQTPSFSPISRFPPIKFATRSNEISNNSKRLTITDNILYPIPTVPAPYFFCRRKNWNSTCYLMQATHQPNSAAYISFGGGDIIPMGLTPPSLSIDKRQPAYNRELTFSFTKFQYLSSQTISVANTPYFIATSIIGPNLAQFSAFSLSSVAGSTQPQMTDEVVLSFPDQCYVVGQATTTLTPISETTSIFSLLDSNGNAPQFQLITYNSLVYLIRAVKDSSLAQIGGLGAQAGLLIDTFLPSVNGDLVLAQAARHKRSGLSYFGSTYTPTSMAESLDNLDYSSVTGETFYAPTIFIPILELDASKGFVADLSSFLGQQVWTFIYPEIVAGPDEFPGGFNLDINGKPILSLQKLHFVYDSLAVLFTPNDLTHKYTLPAKEQILALTNDQIREGIIWRSANVQPYRDPPTNICAQQIIPQGAGYDRANIVYSPLNRPVSTQVNSEYKGMSVNDILSVSGTVYKVEEQTMASKLSGPPLDQSGAKYVSQVSSIQNMVVAVLFDYDNDDLGLMSTYDPSSSTKGVVLLNGYQSSNGYSFSSGDHFDVNDILKSQIPLLNEVSTNLGFDQAWFNTDYSLPRQFWSLTYDSFTEIGLPNYIANVPPSVIDPTFSNRTRSLVLSLQNLQDPVQPTQLGIIDTYCDVVSVNMHLSNGITGSIFLNKKADRDIINIGPGASSGSSSSTTSLFGLPTNYDFFILSRDHYSTFQNGSFDIIDKGYAMSLLDDGSGTGKKVAKYFVDADGNYYELYTYVLSSNGDILETASFTLKITLGTPANITANPPTPETPNNVNPQDMANTINKLSSLVYAAFGPTSPGQTPAYVPIQAVGSQPQALPISGPPGFNGYNLNVMATNRQPVQISNIYSGSIAYPIAGSTTLQPLDITTKRPIDFYGSISHGLDKMQTDAQNETSGGAGTGGSIRTDYSLSFSGSPAIPLESSSSTAAGSTMAGDSASYTYDVLTSTIVDSGGNIGLAGPGQYFIDQSSTPVFVVINLPYFVLNNNTYSINPNTISADGVTSRYTVVVGGRQFLFDEGNKSVFVNNLKFTFNEINTIGAYTVSYTVTETPAGQTSGNVTLSPFTITAGGMPGGLVVDIFNHPEQLNSLVLGVKGRQYSYDPVHATVKIAEGAPLSTVPISTGTVFASLSGYGYVFQAGSNTVNGSPMTQWEAKPASEPAPLPLMTSPKMFTIGGDHYTFDQDSLGNYMSVTGDNQTSLVNPFQFSILGKIYILDTKQTPNLVIGDSQNFPMTSSDTQFNLNGAQYTIELHKNSLNGATVSGEFNVTQGNVIVMENYVYELDPLNGLVIGNGLTYALTTAGSTYTISTTGSTESSFTVTTEQNTTTVTIDDVLYDIGNGVVLAGEVTYPILPYRTFVDGNGSVYNIELGGTVSAVVNPPIGLVSNAPSATSTFDDGQTFTVNDRAAFDGGQYFLISGSPPQFTASGISYTLHNDGVSIASGTGQAYFTSSSANQFQFGLKSITYGTASAAFDGSKYYTMSGNQFTGSGTTFTISGNTAVNEGNSYEIFSNLGQNPYFQGPSGVTYFIGIPVAYIGGTPTGDIYNVFPIIEDQFTVPLNYTFSITGNTVSVESNTMVSAPVLTLTANAGILTGGYFTDPFTKISYTCVASGQGITFVDSNNAKYPYLLSTKSFSAEVIVGINVPVAVNPTKQIYPIQNNQFTVGTTNYSIDTFVAHSNASGPYWPIVNGRFIVPSKAPLSNVSYTIRGTTVTRGYVIDQDDQFSPAENLSYTVDAVNVVKTTNNAQLTGSAPNQTLTSGTSTYTLNSATSTASMSTGKSLNSANQFTIVFSGDIAVTYTVGSVVTDNRNPSTTFPLTSGSPITFTDTIESARFIINSGSILAEFTYQNGFFIDSIAGITYYIDNADNKVTAISYIPQTTQYAFVAANGQTYIIHYNDVSIIFPVISGPHVNVGTATVGMNRLVVHADSVTTPSGTTIATNQNTFEINGNYYSILGTSTGSDYSKCIVAGVGQSWPFTGTNTFVLTDPSVNYTLQVGSNNLPIGVVADFVVKPSRDLISVNDNVFEITYGGVTSGFLTGQGQSSITIKDSSFTLSNNFDATTGRFVFTDINILDAAGVVGQFKVYLRPTFVIGPTTYTLDPVDLVVFDADKRPYSLISNPTMFSFNGSNYVIDTSRTPHAIIGDSNVAPLSTDVTVQRGMPVLNSTFSLAGKVLKYTEDSLRNLLTVTETQAYPVAQPGLTFSLGYGLVFKISMNPPAGAIVGSPVASVAAGTTTCYIFGGIAESGYADFFTYKNIMYTLIKSNGAYSAVQRSYSIYAAQPSSSQQRLAVFSMNGTTYMVTNGSMIGTPSAGINPNTLWSTPSSSSQGGNSSFGLVYGFAPQPINVSKSSVSGMFQFEVIDANSGNITVYDILYASPQAATNKIQIDTPSDLPCFTQSFAFGSLIQSSPLMFETGGYNAFSTLVDESTQPVESFSAAYTTEISSIDPAVDQLITAQGDFTVEFWHSLPINNPQPTGFHPFTLNVSGNSQTTTPIKYIDVDIETPNQIFFKINDTLMTASSTEPIFSTRWRHFAITYTQPYTMMCTGAGYRVDQNTTNLNFNRDFTIVMDFSVDDVNTPQGLLYKGSGSAPSSNMSYSVMISGGAVVFQFTDGNRTASPVFSSSVVLAQTTYRLVITKSTDTVMSGSNQDSTTGATDPYLPPFNTKNTAGAGGTGSLDVNGGTIKNVQTTGLSDSAKNFIDTINAQGTSAGNNKTYSVVISLSSINSDGSVGDPTFQPTPYLKQPQQGTNDLGLTVNNTGATSLYIGSTFDSNGHQIVLGQPSVPPGKAVVSTGNISGVYLFNTAVSVWNFGDVVKTRQSLLQAGVLGYWTAAYDSTGLVQNGVDPNAVAVSENAGWAFLAPMTGRELEGSTLYLNGFALSPTLVSPLVSSSPPPPSSIGKWVQGSSALTFNSNNSNTYTMTEIMIWNACRQPYQVLNDMFGRLVVANEPTLALYLSSSFPAQSTSAQSLPLLPMNQYIDSIPVTNPLPLVQIDFTPASKSLVLCPAVATCGPLITPNLFTPQAVGLTVADSLPYMTTYSTTVNNVTSGLAGELIEAYVYISKNTLTVLAGKKIGDLALSWVSQEQGDVQVTGYIEGAPPVPMANLTGKAYPGATSLTLSAPTTELFSYSRETNNEDDNKLNLAAKPVEVKGDIKMDIAPFGFGIHSSLVDLAFSTNSNREWDASWATTSNPTSTKEFDESNKYTVKLQGTLAPIQGDLFMKNINAATIQSTSGSSSTAILPDPNLGGFTSSNAPSALPTNPQADEKFGSPMFLPSPYGEAFVTSTLFDVYQQTLLQSNTIFGYIRVKNLQVPPDVNILPFRMSSKYIRPGCLDGVVGYVYNPASLPSGMQTYTTSTGQMQVLYDKNFSSGSIGHSASYMKLVETYQLKKRIDQEAFNLLALYQTAYQNQDDPSEPSLTPGLDFYNEYVWNSRGGSQEIKHNFTSTFDTVSTSSNNNTITGTDAIECAISVESLGIVDLTLTETNSLVNNKKHTIHNTGTAAFDITASFDGIESDTQMRYTSNNDAHFVLRNNSMYNSSNKSGLNLVVGSDGRVFNIGASVASGAGIPQSDNIDDAMTYTQPLPAYSTGNASGSMGALEPYDRPGKTSSFRSYAFFLQPSNDNADTFWNTVIDQTWLANSSDPAAVALRGAKPPNTVSIPWRILYRVTDSERFPAPISDDVVAVPNITPVMAVPVRNPATDFLYTDLNTNGARSPLNPTNDITANIVLVPPSASGRGVASGEPPNNVIPFDLVNIPSKLSSWSQGSKSVNWGDTNNSSLLLQLLNSVLGQNIVKMSTYVAPGSQVTGTILDNNGGVLYTTYLDPNGFTVNVPRSSSTTVFQDVNGNPIQYFDGKLYHSLQEDYIASLDGSLLLYIQPPQLYDQSNFSLTGDYDLFGNPGDAWRYYYVSAYSSDLTAELSVNGIGPFHNSLSTSSPYAGFSIANAQHTSGATTNQVLGYVLCKGLMQWPNLNTNSETFADVMIYKAMSLWDTFPIGDVGVLIAFLKAQFPNASFVAEPTTNDEISMVFAKNIFSYFNSVQQGLGSGGSS